MRRLLLYFLTAGILALPAFSFSQSAAEFTFVDFEKIINSGKVKTVEALIAALPESYRKKYVLMYGSRSMQESSVENPRAILFGDTAKVIVTFNGNSKQAGYNSVEVMSYDDASGATTLHEYTFNGTTAPTPAHSPGKCIRCHGEPTRPIWDAYHVWPGAYGSLHQAIFFKKAVQLEDDNRAQEQPKYNRYLKSKAKNPRYNQLVDVEVRKYEDDDGLPLVDLGKAVMGFRSNALAAQLSRQPEIAKFRYALLASAGFCVDLEDFFPKQLRETFKTSLKQMFVRVSAGQKKGRLSVLARQRALSGKKGAGDFGEALDRNPDATILDDPTQPANFAYVAEAAGLSTAGLAPTLEYDSFLFNDGYGGINRISKPLLKRLFNPVKDAEIFEMTSKPLSMAGPYKVVFHQSDCARLKDLSLAAFEQKQEAAVCTACLAPKLLRQSNLADLQTVRTALPTGPFAKCVRCHSGDDSDIREIPFNNPEKLRSYLKKKPELRAEILLRIGNPPPGVTKMPADGELTPSELSEIRAYIGGFEAGS